MNWGFRNAICCLLFSLPFCAIYAQEYLFDIEQFTTEDGLSHNQVRCIFEDSRGILWIGTPNGLNRFDGESFKLFTKEKHGLSTNLVESIVEDKDGMLWLKVDAVTQTYRGSGITIFNPFKERAEDNANYLGSSLPFNVNAIQEIRAGPERAIFLSTTDSTALIYKGKSNYSEKDIIKLPTDIFIHIPFLWEKSDTTFWIGTGGYEYGNINDLRPDITDLVKIDSKGNILKKIQSPYLAQTPKLGYKNSVNKLLYFTYFDKSNQFIFYHYQLEDDQLRVMKFWQNGKRIDLSKAGTIQYLDEESGLMIISDNYSPDGANRRTYFYFIKALGKWDYEILSEGILPIQGSAINIIKAQNSIWFQSAGSGLYRLKLRAKKFQIFNSGVQQRNLITDVANRIWISAKDAYADDNFFSLGFRAHSEILVKDELDCIWGYHYHYQTLVQACPPDYKPQYFIDKLNAFDRAKGYSHFFKDNNKRIWVFPSAQILNSNGELSPFKSKTALDSLEFFTVYHVWQAVDNNFWVATGGALFELDENLNLLGTYNQSGNGKYYLPSDNVHHFQVDRDGIFWLACGGEGLIRWDRKKETIRQFTKNDGLASNILHAVYEDDYGFLWLNSENGIIRFNKEIFTSTRYGMEAGISNLEGNSRSHFRDEDGTLYFGSYVGVTEFHPNDFINDGGDFRPDEIKIFSIYQKDVRTGKIINLLPNYMEKGWLELTNRRAFLEVSFVPPDIDVIRNSRFEYQLKGENEDWIQLEKNKMTLADLPYGTYEVKVRNSDFNLNSTPVLTIPISNPAPFYLQWWFFLFSFVGVILTSIIYGRIRTKNLKLQREKLREEVAKQTSTIQEKNQLLEKQATELRNLDEVKSRFFAHVSHELRTPLTLLLGPIQSVLKRNRLENRDFTLLKLAKENGQQLLGMINQILDLTKLESGKLELQEETVDLYSLVRRIYSFFESHAELKGIEMQFHYEPDRYLKVWLDGGKFETLLNNLLSNALKFTTKNGEVVLKIIEKPNRINIEVSDTGRGIHPDDLPYVFDRYFQTSQKDVAAEGGSGIGLAICKEFAELLGGTLGVTSELGKGTQFHFEFPKKEVLANTTLTPQKAGATANGAEIKQSSIKSIAEETSAEEKPTILLVEDNHSLRDYIVYILETQYNVITATNGQEALERLTVDGGQQTENAEKNRPPSTINHQPSLIISDVMMPIMDGFQFLKELKSKEKWRGIPVVMLTARAALSDKLNALRIGVDDYMTKPFEEEELLTRIQNLLNNLTERQLWREKQSNGHQLPAIMSGEDAQWLEDLENVLKEKLGDFNLTAEQLASDLNLSRRQFFRRVKMLTGLTPNQYMLEIKYNHARYLFENRIKSSVKAVAFEIGVKDVKYFSKQFKQRFGKLPSEYFMNA